MIDIKDAHQITSESAYRTPLINNLANLNEGTIFFFDSNTKHLHPVPYMHFTTQLVPGCGLVR